MKLAIQKYHAIYGILIVSIIASSCQEDDAEPSRIPINSFSMVVDGEAWVPFHSKEDTCSSTFIGQYGFLGESPMCTIYAFKDPEGIDDAESENLLRTRIMNVVDTGTYILDGSYENDFDSYFLFVVEQPDGVRKRYVNNPVKNQFQVHIEELYPMEEGSSSLAYSGSFEGVLYNEQDSSDSLTISQGQFKFGSVNYDDHCGL